MIDKHILRDILPAKKYLMLMICANFVQAMMIALSAYIIAYIADKLLFDRIDYQTATPLLALLFLFFIIKAWLNYYNHRKMEDISLTVQSKLRVYLLEALIYNSALNEYKAKGNWLALITKGVDKLDIYLTHFLPQLGILITFPVVLLICAFISDWISGLVFLITAPLIPLFMILIGKIADSANKRQWKVFQQLTIYMADLLPGLLVIKAYNQVDTQIKQITANGEKFSTATLKVLKIAFLSAFMLEFISTLSIAIIAVNIGLRLIYGQAQFLPVFFILLIAPQFYQPFRQFGSAFHDAMNGITASSEIYQLVAKVKQLKLSEGKNIILTRPPCINFDHVNFAYTSDKVVLSDFNFTIKAGQQVVLTGKNGIGKSTIFKLLLKLNEPTSGKIMIDQDNLTDIDTNCWHKQIGWVAQEPYIFSTTIKENIALGRTCTLDEIKQVCKHVNLADFIRTLPNGYDTIIGSNIKLSSGQIRRLGIARALLGKPKILLLDEPMENLDSQNEALMQNLLLNLKGKITTIIIAHRLQTIKNAHKVMVLTGDKLVEIDNIHDYLAKGASSYD